MRATERPITQARSYTCRCFGTNGASSVKHFVQFCKRYLVVNRYLGSAIWDKSRLKMHTLQNNNLA